MTGIMNGIELLAPAGAMAQLKAAAASGADAVYLGVSEFSARAGAGNFTFDELKDAVRYCHERDIKVHCAINTLIKESELKRAAECAARVSECGADALIVQDVGFAAYLRRSLPDMELHASTQMTVTSLEGVRYLEEHGYSRVVLARELSRKELERIAAGAKAELEVFVHGAICMCYSGQCLMSSVLGGRSGNRGRCAQPCRLKYTLEENGKALGETYALSPKDLALAEHLAELRDMGIASLKIEGRLKSAEYVAAVTGIYRKYLDSSGKVTKEDMRELRNAFSRSGFTDGYFTGKLGCGMMAHKDPSNNSGNVFTDAVKRRASGREEKRIGVYVFASLSCGRPLSVTMYDDSGRCVTVQGSVAAEKARTTPLTEEKIKEQLGKLGSTPFEASEINVETEDDITVPIRDINETRRRAADALLEERAKRQKKRTVDVPMEFGDAAEVKEMYLTAEVVNIEQGMAAIRTGGIKRIYAPPNIAAELTKISGGGTEFVTKTADIFRPESIATTSVSVSSPAALRYYGERAKYGDFRLNVYNSLTAREFSQLRCVTLSPELNMREIADITAHIGKTETEIIGYGRLPLMVMKNCSIKALGRCGRGERKITLRDRKNMEFPVMCSDECRAILLNSKPIFTADIMESIRKLKINGIRLNFTVEKSEQCGKIIDEYRRAAEGLAVRSPKVNTFTRGHLKRGVI